MLCRESQKRASMKHLAIFLLIIFALSPKAISYPEDQFQACIASEKLNPNLTSVSKASIESYCDCALSLILDQERDSQSSGYECATKHFKK